MRRAAWTSVFVFNALLFTPSLAVAETPSSDLDFAETCAGAKQADGRIVCADLAALDQTLVYNRFGSFNPFGMIFALRRDLVEMEDEGGALPTAAICDAKLGTEASDDDLDAGEVRLKDCKRPRPVVLRVNVGDRLLLRVTNYLKPADEAEKTAGNVVDFTKDFCLGEATDDANRAAVFDAVSRGDAALLEHGEAACPADDDDVEAEAGGGHAATSSDWPNTRGLNLVAQGLTPLPDPVSGDIHGACTGMDAVPPDGDFWCMYVVPQEGTYFFAPTAATAGGEGDGGSIVHGLFGAVVAEKAGSRWYRSQTSLAAFNEVWPANTADGMPRHARTGLPEYEKTAGDDVPILNMAMPVDGTAQSDFAAAGALELVHTDLNAIIFCDSLAPGADCRENTDGNETQTREPAYHSFREFSVFFHDEIKSFYTRHFEDLDSLGQLAGVRDGFAINYGASGMGTLLLANRKGMGPASECMECLYEEFFLASWANGDPALLEWFADDPSNVHHSYLNDPVSFRNFHAGPKETHVFHLHAHQWFAGNDPNRGTYLDSQTVAPQQGFTYNIYHGGLRNENGTGQGWWDTQGSGNRNRTVGDSIFHCHLYPHFAQGMWALWRVHDVLEDGTRKLPDGQANEGLSVDFEPQAMREDERLGSVDRLTGAWHGSQKGTPVPALIPLPGEPLPLLPTYADPAIANATPMPGYPFYIAGEAGHRPPQAPLDIARDLGPNPGLNGASDPRVAGAGWLDGGLGRHIVRDGSERKLGFEIPAAIVALLANPDLLTDEKRSTLMSQIVAKAFALGDLSAHLTAANIEILDNAGTNLERAAMGFHYDGKLYDPDGTFASDALILKAADGSDSTPGSGDYTTLTAPVPNASPVTARNFYVNGSAPKPGAPFADPCGAPAGLQGAQVLAFDPLMLGQNASAYTTDPLLLGFRRYEASAVQLDLIVNQAGWHDPQARINVLTARSDAFKDTARPEAISPTVSDKEEPFFFRALSGECIEFRHTNELPKELALDDFQVKTPTDTVGQHIHLVKFDVTASDGSGNGWNYEDGTSAPDEIAARRCAAANGTLEGTLSRPIAGGECVEGEPALHDIWRLPLADNRELFQTTVQRWFADPILSRDENAVLRDRTLRTVFTHDHFGPSSIQQHGFYSALVIEPGVDVSGPMPRPLLGQICENDRAECATPLSDAQRLVSVAWGEDIWEGTRKRVTMAAADPIHPDYREFALSIADFATLYDPRDRISVNAFTAGVSLGPDLAAGSDDVPAAGNSGMARLYCEMLWRRSPYILQQLCDNPAIKDETGSWYFEGELPPAWIAGGRNRDDIHEDRYHGDLVVENLPGTNEVAELRDYFIAYRQKAAGLFGTGAGAAVATLAKPVAPPARPESISVDHHDPYLVNYRGAPIPLRIGDKDTGPLLSSSCAPMAMTRQGDHTPQTSEVEAALLGGTFPRCSYAYQIAGDMGDMGGALSSFLHGDPETPVFEAYQDERLMFRMIQGAQEVQHTFVLYGQPHKRNIDQAFERAMQPLGMTADFAASMRQACFDMGAGGRPSEYLRWLDTAPINLLPGDIDEVFFAEYEEMLARCDNIEGFTFAQEIGISEHFEVRGSLRSDVSASMEMVLSEGFRVPEGGTGAASSDYLYSFGTTDAIWNGSWGLMRVYRDPHTIDPNTDPELGGEPGQAPEAIGSRLLPVRAAELGNEGVLIGDSRIDPSGGLTCPMPRPGETVNIVEAAIVALETRRIWPEGTAYGNGRRDPDGLMFALLDPEAPRAGGIDADGWNELQEEAVRAAVAAAYSAGPEPMVLRVHAGDCVRLRFVNLLTPGEDGGMRDVPGDARMPPIAPLNTDPPGSTINPGERVGVLERTDAGSLLRPSATLAVSIGLPGMDLIKDIPHGFGYNSPALPAAGGGEVPASDVLTFFAGRFRFDPNAETNSLLGTMTTLFEAYLNASPVTLPGGGTFPDPTAAGFVSARPAVAEDGEVGLFQLLGEPYVAVLSNVTGGSFPDPTTGFALDNTTENRDALIAGLCPAGDLDCAALVGEWHGATMRLAQLATAYALDENVHWIPYAFGAVPVTSLSDIISHGTEGLVGTIDVVPADWTADGLAAPRREAIEVMPGAPVATVLRRSAGHMAGAGDGMPAVYSVLHEGEQKAIREFVLFYQDGLNLWDDDSAIRWDWDDKTRVRLPDGSAVRMVPECIVCDDSYDLGEAGVNYRSAAFADVLRDALGISVEENDDLNTLGFPPDLLANAASALRLQACEGEQIVIRVIHPGGRARQRTFVMNGYTYDDIFPGFGFPRSTLLAPGKSMTAWLYPEAVPGTAVWHDGPTFLRAAGVWGLLETARTGEGACAG